MSVADVVHAHILAAEHGRVGERYILAGENLSYRDAFTTVCDIVNRPESAVVLPRWAIPVAAAAVAAARAVLGPRLPIDGKQMRLSSADIYAGGQKARNERACPALRSAQRSGAHTTGASKRHYLKKKVTIPETRRSP